MATTTPSPTHPARWRKIAACLLFLVLGGALLWPHLKTLPRRAVARFLADRLGAEVQLEELRFASSHRFLLRGLTVTLPTSLPEVEHVTVDEMEVEAKWKQLLAGHLDLLTLRGVELSLRPPPPTLTTAPSQTPTIARLLLEPAQVTITSREGTNSWRFQLQAEVTEFGETTPEANTLHHLLMTAEELSLPPLMEVAHIELPANLKAGLSHLHLEFEHTAEGDQLELRATALHASLEDGQVEGSGLVAKLHHHGGTVRGTLASDQLQGALGATPFELPSPSLTLTGEPQGGEEKLLRLTLEPHLPGLGPTHLTALVDLATDSWRELEATVEATRWDELWPALGIEATSALHLVDDGQNLHLEATFRSPKIHLAAADLDLDDVVLSFQGLTPHPPSWRQPPTSLTLQSLALNHGGGHLGELPLPRKLQVKGHLSAPQWPRGEAQLQVSGVELFSDQPFPLRLAALRVDLASAQVTDLSRLQIRSLETTGEFSLPPRLPLLPFALQASAHLLPGTGLAIDSMLLDLPTLAKIAGTGRWSPGPDGGRVDLRCSDIDLARWQALLGSPDFAFTLAGQGEAEFTAQVRDDGSWQVTGPARLRNGGFTSTDGSRVMEGLRSDLDLVVEGSGATPQRATAKGGAGGFALLWGTFFGDFQDLAGQVDLEAETADGFSSWHLDSHFGLPGTLGLHAQLESPAITPGDPLNFNLDFTAEDLGSVQRNLLARFEGLEDLDVGGRLQFEVEGEVRAADQWSVAGALTVNDLHWNGTLATVNGLDLYFPLALEQQGTEFSGRRRLGDLRFNRLTVRDLEVPPLASALWVEADSFGLSEPLELPVFGGRIIMDRLGASRLLRPDRFLESGLRLEGLDLDRIATDLELFPLEGTLEGNFPRMLLRDHDLEVEGGGRIDLFGGSVEVRDIRGKNLFSPFPEFTLSADLRNLDLGRLTRRIDFGEMTGILDGDIEGCRLFRGVPVTCQATFRTVEQDHVKRTVDIKAVNNLTILGTGQSTSILDRGVQRFLKRFTYAALGVELHLADDRLRMRGLEKRGERELFLRGRLPFPIDIVNAQPGGAVSFQAMLRRFKSLDFSQAETTPP